MNTASWIVLLIIAACVPMALVGAKKTDGCGGCGGRGSCPGCRHRRPKDRE